MTGMSNREAVPSHTQSATRAAWAVLIGMGGTSVTYNVFHAIHHGEMNPFLALLYGIAPVFAAACLSHIVAVHDGGWFMKTVTFAVMLGAMGLSIGATGSVVAPAAGPWLRWLFGGVLDAAALVALRVILDSRNRKAEALAEAEALRAEAETARSQAHDAAAAAARLTEELAAVRGELAAAQETVQARVPARSSGRKRGRNSGQKARTSSTQNTGASSGVSTGGLNDVDTQAEALRILSEEPDIAGSELGRRLGLSERYGCILKNRLAATVTGPEPS